VANVFSRAALFWQLKNNYKNIHLKMNELNEQGWDFGGNDSSSQRRHFHYAVICLRKSPK